MTHFIAHDTPSVFHYVSKWATNNLQMMWKLVRQQHSDPSCLTLKGASSAYKVILVCALKDTLCTYTSTQSYTLTILVLTSFSMALTSSAALGTSEEDCIDVSKAEDWERKRRIKSNSMLERLAEKAGRGGEKSYNENAKTDKLLGC